MILGEEWRDLPNFPGYKISNRGLVYSDKYNRCLTPQVLHNGSLSVTMQIDKRQYHRSVALLVAKTFLDPPMREDFISPIHLDGNKQNCYVENLMWRPRWFVNDFHRERMNSPYPNWRGRFKNLTTDEWFDHPSECAMKYGVLETHVYLGMANHEPVWPQGHLYLMFPDRQYVASQTYGMIDRD